MHKLRSLTERDLSIVFSVVDMPFLWIVFENDKIKIHAYLGYNRQSFFVDNHYLISGNPVPKNKKSLSKWRRTYIKLENLKNRLKNTSNLEIDLNDPKSLVMFEYIVNNIISKVQSMVKKEGKLVYLTNYSYIDLIQNALENYTSVYGVFYKN